MKKYLFKVGEIVSSIEIEAENKEKAFQKGIEEVVKLLEDSVVEDIIEENE